MMISKKYKNLFFIGFSILLYFFFAYFIERTEFKNILIIWSLLFACFYYLVRFSKLSFTNLYGISILFRLVLLFSLPNLSQDFYRFIWDGRLILEGLNPYLTLPETFIEQNLSPIYDAKKLYLGMGELNGSHYTNYPPLNQLNFLLAAIFGFKNIFTSIITLRIQIILADIGIIYFGRKILEKLNITSKNIFLYALNPYVIIEMTGNLHFEPVMLFFLIWSFYKLLNKSWMFSAVLLGCSISIKLIPLIFIPLYFNYFKINEKRDFFKFLKFSLISISTVIILFTPFYSYDLLLNYSNSLGLWFRNFEFNASFYYLLREIGYSFRGYNEIAIIGKIGPTLTVSLIGIILYIKKYQNIVELISSMLIILSFYYFTSTTIHPWYLATLLLLSIFTKYRFTVLWSFLIILSYHAYANNPWKENLYYVGLEYFSVYGFLIYEIYKNGKKKSFFNNFVKN